MVWPIVFLLLLSACGGTQSLSSKCKKLDTITLIADNHMNQGRAMAVDVVNALHPRLAKILRTMSASQYFHQIDQIRRDHSAFIQVWRFEVTPQQKILSVVLEEMKNPIFGMFVFADYYSDGDHRIDACSMPHVALNLKENHMIFLKGAPFAVSSKSSVQPAAITQSLDTRFK